MARWTLVEADLHSEYQIDVEDPDLLYERTGRWLEARILGLLAGDTRLARHFQPPPKKEKAPRRRPRG